MRKNIDVNTTEFLTVFHSMLVLSKLLFQLPHFLSVGPSVLSIICLEIVAKKIRLAQNFTITKKSFSFLPILMKLE